MNHSGWVVVIVRHERVDHAQVRLIRACVDHAARRPVGAAELARAEHVAVNGHELEMRQRRGTLSTARTFAWGWAFSVGG